MRDIPKRKDYLLLTYINVLQEWAVEAKSDSHVKQTLIDVQEKYIKELKDILSNIYHLDKVPVSYNKRIKKNIK